MFPKLLIVLLIATMPQIKTLRSCRLAIIFVCSYLFDRRQFIRTNSGITSLTSHVTFGVPQGSLFVVNTFDIWRVINKTTLIFYADNQQLRYTFNPTSVLSAGILIVT